MKKITLIPVLLLLLTACKKDLQDVNITDSEFITTKDFQVNAEEELTLKGEVVSGNVTEYGFVVNYSGRSPFVGSDEKVGSQTGTSPFSGSFTARFTAFYPDFTYAIRAYGIINGQVYYGKTVRYTSPARGSWKRMRDFPGAARKFPVSFAVNGKGYVGCGYGPAGNLKDMWEYDPATDTWTQVADYPGDAMHAGFSFVIGNKAYVGGGGSYDAPPYNTHSGFLSFYEFDAITKNWTKLDDVPIGAYPYSPGLFGCFAFAVGGQGFVGGGSISLQTRNFGLYKFDPSTKTWEAYASGPKDYKGDALYIHYGAAFVLGDLAFIGTGYNTSDFDDKTNGFWQWNYMTKEWKTLGPVPGPQIAFGVGTTNNAAGLLGSGDASNDFFQYKVLITGNFWKQVSHNPDNYGSKGGICFTIDNKTYIGLGEPILPALHEPNRIYEYTHTR